MNFPERLKMIRKDKGVTQKQTGEAIGSNDRAIRNYEIEARKPEFDALIALADYFEVSLDYLLGRTDNPEVNSRRGCGPTLDFEVFAKELCSEIAELYPIKGDSGIEKLAGTYADISAKVAAYAIAKYHREHSVAPAQKPE